MLYAPQHPLLFIAVATILFTVGVLAGAVLARRLPPPPRPRRLSDAQILARVAPPPAPAAPPPPPAPTLGVLVRDHLTDQKGIETLEWVTVGAVVLAAALVAFSAELAPGINDAAHRLRLLLP